MMARAQASFTEGVPYVGIVVYCSSQKDAEDVAKAYLHRGDLKYIPHSYKQKFRIGTMAFTPMETTVTYLAHQEFVFVVTALSNKMIYIVSKIPTLPKEHSKINLKGIRQIAKLDEIVPMFNLNDAPTCFKE